MTKQKRDKARREQVTAYTYLVQFSINMIVPIFACTFFGYWLDNKIGTSFLVIVGFFIGAISGGTSIYKISKKMLTKDETSWDYPVVEEKKTKDDTHHD
ncbi:Putative F0F1-ATPase subunit Ca2+/Mg2+ transporter [Lachnospiraceae bacterium XBB1006]|nr:Putative F0F1-ATPase subunit Ca2+/Mg2+ transporter [Lachnospiraceae bacterium XBB1006]